MARLAGLLPSSAQFLFGWLNGLITILSGGCCRQPSDALQGRGLSQSLQLSIIV